MTLQQLKEEAQKKFDNKFTFIYQERGLKDRQLMKPENKGASPQEIKDFIGSLITKAYEEGKR